MAELVSPLSRVFVDMDGVLADFDAHHAAVFGWRPDKEKDDVDWTLVRAVPNFYLGLPPMADMRELWDFVSCLHHRPIVLTGIPRAVEEAADNKRAWVRKNLGPEVEVRCCPSREKYLHAAPGDLLVDDWEKYRHLWEGAGGRFVLHRSASGSIAALRELGLKV